MSSTYKNKTVKELDVFFVNNESYNDFKPYNDFVSLHTQPVLNIIIPSGGSI